MHKLCGAGDRPWRAIPIAALGALAFFVVGAGATTGGSIGCGETITQDTKLDHDLIDCPGDGIIIGTDNITLDLNGHMIDGKDPCCSLVGVRNGTRFPDVNGYDNVTIEGGTIRQFPGGVRVFGATANTVRNVTVTETGTAISLEDTNADVIERSRLSGNLAAVHIRGSGSNLIRNNVISDNRLGLMLVETSGDNAVERNAFVANSDRAMFFEDIFSGTNRVVNNRLSGTGIIFVEASGFEVVRNSISHSRSAALLLIVARNNRIEENVLSQNAIGMDLQTESSNNRIAGNSIVDNTGPGVSLADFPPGNEGNTLIDNVVSRNGADGIFIGLDNPGNVVQENLANRNGDDGIDVDEPTSALAHNTANRNGDLGIEAVPGVIDGGGNRAKGNGNPLQCLNVACS
jgi:parallel beta-helix repeat protein